jgi:hypothetical protein
MGCGTPWIAKAGRAERGANLALKTLRPDWRCDIPPLAKEVNVMGTPEVALSWKGSNSGHHSPSNETRLPDSVGRYSHDVHEAIITKRLLHVPEDRQAERCCRWQGLQGFLE